MPSGGILISQYSPMPRPTLPTISIRLPRVLVLESTFIFGGVENLLLNIFTRLPDAAERVTFCSLYEPGPMGPKFQESGCRFEHSLMRCKADPLGFLRLRRILKRDRIEVVYIVLQPLTLFWGYLASRSLGIPVVCLVGNTLNIRAHPKLKIYRFILPHVAAIVAQAEAQREHLIENAGFPERLLHVISNGVDCASFSETTNRLAMLRSLGIPPDAKIVGINARMVLLKGIDVFLQAAALLRDSSHDIHFVLVGTGPDEQGFRDLAAHLKITSVVHFLGFREDLRALTSIYDVAVLASRTEAFPMVLLEYMAAGRAICATDVGSVSEVVSNRNEVLLVPADSPSAIADAVRTLLNDHDLSLRLSESARSTVTGRFSISQTVGQTDDLLTTIVTRNRP